MSIDWAEWRDFFSLCASNDVEDLIAFWRTSVVSYPPHNYTVTLSVNALTLHAISVVVILSYLCVDVDIELFYAGVIGVGLSD